jgi:hypothetical protein
LIPYKDAEEYCTKVPVDFANVRELIAEVFDHKPATKF